MMQVAGRMFNNRVAVQCKANPCLANPMAIQWQPNANPMGNPTAVQLCHTTLFVHGLSGVMQVAGRIHAMEGV